jgi:hypothetical protein
MQIKKSVVDVRSLNNDTLMLLDIISKDAGFRTLDEYEAEAFKQLSKDDRDAINKIKTDVENVDKDLAIAYKTFRGPVALGLSIKEGCQGGRFKNPRIVPTHLLGN